MADDLASQGFEIVTDESGQELVKLLFMDENDESSGYALVSPEDAKRIMNGEATLQNIIDEDGKQVLTLVPVEQDQLTLHVRLDASLLLAIRFINLLNSQSFHYLYLLKRNF